MNEKLNLSSPWQTYVNELAVMFENDPEVQVMYDETKYEVKLYIWKNHQKAEALEKLLNHEKQFGNITLKITVVPPNGVEAETDILEVFRKAFEGNNAMLGVLPVESPMGTYRYVVFENKVVQFYNDQLDDPHGYKTTLYQEIAKDIFADGLAVNYCTDPKE